MSSSKIHSFILSIFVAGIALIQVIILNQYSTKGEKLTEINLKINDVDKENTRLVQEIASASSMISISEKAKILGFLNTSAVVSFAAPPPIAQSLDLSL